MHIQLLMLAVHRAWRTDPGSAARRILVDAAARLGGQNLGHLSRIAQRRPDVRPTRDRRGLAINLRRGRGLAYWRRRLGA